MCGMGNGIPYRIFSCSSKFGSMLVDRMDSGYQVFKLSEKWKMSQEQMMSIAIAGGLVFAAWKFGSGVVKAGAVAVGAVVVAKQIPYINRVL